MNTFLSNVSCYPLHIFRSSVWPNLNAHNNSNILFAWMVGERWGWCDLKGEKLFFIQVIQRITTYCQKPETATKIRVTVHFTSPSKNKSKVEITPHYMNTRVLVNLTYVFLGKQFWLKAIYFALHAWHGHGMFLII